VSHPHPLDLFVNTSDSEPIEEHHDGIGAVFLLIRCKIVCRIIPDDVIIDHGPHLHESLFILSTWCQLPTPSWTVHIVFLASTYSLFSKMNSHWSLP
jgi:hypothetical protein